MMTTLAKSLVGIGAILMIAGLLLWALSRFFPQGLPGDISIRRGNFGIWIPIASSILLSIIGTLLLYFWSRLTR